MKKMLKYLGISMGLSFAFAVTYVVVMTLTLPKTDLAHGQTPFQDPLVFPIMSIVAGISGLVAWPLFTVLGRYSPPVIVAMITGLTTLLFIVVATPIQPGIGLFGAYVYCLSGRVDLLFSETSKYNGQQSAGVNKKRSGIFLDVYLLPRCPARSRTAASDWIVI